MAGSSILLEVILKTSKALSFRFRRGPIIYAGEKSDRIDRVLTSPCKKNTSSIEMAVDSIFMRFWV